MTGLAMKNLVFVLAMSLSALALANTDIKFTDVKKPVKCAKVKELLQKKKKCWSIQNRLMNPLFLFVK
jgi:hypothetical protein